MDVCRTSDSSKYRSAQSARYRMPRSMMIVLPDSRSYNRPHEFRYVFYLMFGAKNANVYQVVYCSSRAQIRVEKIVEEIPYQLET